MFVLALIVSSVAIFYLVSVWLPARGITHIGPVLTVRPPLARPLGGILLAPAERAPGSFFGLRPFGLHREGLPGMLWQLGSFVSLLIMSVIALFLAPRRVGVMAQVVSNGCGQRLLTFVLGLMGYLGAGLLSFLIFINVVGWPLAIVLGLGLYLATAFGLVAVSLAVGSGLCRSLRVDQGGPVLRLSVGILVLFLGSIIPYIGWLVAGGSAVLGFGAVLWTRGGGTAGWSLDDVDV